VAQYGDACNFFPLLGRSQPLYKLQVLRDHCEAASRPYEEIEKTTIDWVTISDAPVRHAFTVDQALAYFEDLAQMGIDHAIVIVDNLHEPDALAAYQERIIPAVHLMAVAGRSDSR
jgi:hypothetical protein